MVHISIALVKIIKQLSKISITKEWQPKTEEHACVESKKNK